MQEGYEPILGADPAPARKTRTIVVVGLGFLGLVAAVVVYCTLPRASWHDTASWLQTHEALGRIAFTLVYALCIVICCPSTIFDLFAGYTFGVGWGAVVAIAGKFLGSIAAFGIGRYLIQDRVREHLDGGRPMFRAWALLIEHHEIQFAVLIQLAYLPIALKNYGLSILNVSFWTFALSTLLIGGAESYLSVLLGHSTTKMSAILIADPQVHSPESHAAQATLVLVAAAASVGLVIFVSYRVRSYIDALTADDETTSLVAHHVV